MNVFIVYCHPDEDSFTRLIRDSFIDGLKSSGYGCVISDLYKMNFTSEMNRDEYRREAHYRIELPVPDDVLIEQEKINSSDAVAFIYPLFWSDVPAKLKGWFDRVWTFGFAYGENRTMKLLEKALVLVSAGNTLDYFEKTGIGEAMKKIMLDDRLFDRVKHKEMFIFEATSRETDARELNREKHLRKAFELGKNF